MNITSENTAELYDSRLQLRNKTTPVTLILTENGTVIESNEKSEKLLGLTIGKTGRKHISSLIPLLTEIDLLEKGNERVNPYLRFLSRIGHRFKVTGAQGRELSCLLYFSDIEYDNQHLIMVMIHPA
ncbi:hypothetical protein [Nitrosomonas marina]|uniref:PAS domain S-box-containing protein n=1 Tax=Nitrosomonas marina TaxID=917 RepID=A0A1H8H238_9PROT|nr:hypothetical protein [Nitrosomonas marina]SEN50079.1 hypothetical protein SAMN05216325_12113 [Nitrosomonas marina]